MSRIRQRREARPGLSPGAAAMAGAAIGIAMAWWALPILGADSTEAFAPRLAGAEACAACHQAEHEEWRTSKHAGAFSKTFVSYWKAGGESPECLACHTTGFEAARGTFAFEGVSCEACHGPLKEGHPGAETMALPTDSTACMACHRQTYLEWQLSGHAKQRIRCFDCHAVHRQGLRQPEPEQQCGACHAQRLEDFAHATHHLQGLTCTTCHMPQPRTSGIGGTGAPAHSFFVGAETCTACHEEMVHKGHKMNTLSEEVARLSQEASVQHAERLQSQASRLELELDIEKARGTKRALGLLLAGLVIGALASGLTWRRRNGQRPKEPPP